MKKIAIIGSSYFQEPLIQKAKSMGLETHVFAWASGDVGEKSADFFYPISIIEKDKILSKCLEIGIDGICSIASDLAPVTVNYIANKMGLVGNSLESTYMSTNKHAMRECFFRNNNPSPKSLMISSINDLANEQLIYPIIVKPVDSSSSRGITKLSDEKGLAEAICFAKQYGSTDNVLVEEFIEGKEYSVECISYCGKHSFLALTQKYTTGSPHFIETGHLQPAQVSQELLEKIKNVTFQALDSLKIENGASHTELKVTPDGRIMLIEIGGRMGGDHIGGILVEQSTGIDFVKAVIQVALGNAPDLRSLHQPRAAAIRFIFSLKDLDILSEIKNRYPEILIEDRINGTDFNKIIDSASRCGYFILSSSMLDDLMPFLPYE